MVRPEKDLHAPRCLAVVRILVAVPPSGPMGSVFVNVFLIIIVIFFLFFYYLLTLTFHSLPRY